MPINLNQHRCRIGTHNTLYIIGHKSTIQSKNVSRIQMKFSANKNSNMVFKMVVFFMIIFSHFKCNEYVKHYKHNKPSLKYIKIYSTCTNNYREAFNHLSNNAMYSLYGNKNKNNNLKLYHWNKGSANFNNKLNEIKNLINTNKPDVLNLAEANININDNNFSNNFYDYKIETTKMASVTNIARSSLLIKKSIPYKRRHDLEDTITSTIWIEISIPKSKSMLVMGGYRQWTIPKYFNIIKSKSITNQMNRWLLLLDKWKTALKENKDTIVMMDDNIDSTYNSSHNLTYKLKPLKDALKNLLVNNNLIVHNNKITHYSTIYPNSCIDHIYSNCFNKISNSTTIMTGASDHAHISIVYSSTENIIYPKFIKI